MISLTKVSKQKSYLKNITTKLTLNFFEYPRIEKINRQYDDEITALEERLLKEYRKNLSLFYLLERVCLIIRLYYLRCLGYHYPGFFVNHMHFFKLTPSIFTIRDFKLTPKERSSIVFAGLSYYMLKGAVISKVSNPHLKAYFSLQFKVQKFILKQMGVDQRTLDLADFVAERLAKKFK